MIRAAIFDLDGLLVDTEPLWRRSEIEILTPLGVPITEDMCRQTQGDRVDRAIAHWFERFAWEGPTVGEVAQHVFDRVLDLVRTEAKPMPGALAAVRYFSERGLPVAVCSSSWTALIDAALEKVGLADDLPIRYSAENDEYGKPHPACYLATAAKLGVKPQDCLAFEDSFHGTIAARAALMTIVAIPEPSMRHPTRWGFCDAVLDSLEEINGELVAELDGCDSTSRKGSQGRKGSGVAGAV